MLVNSRDGEMSQVIVIFDPEAVRGKSAAQVQGIIRATVQRQLGREPAELNILPNTASQPQGK
ncbi:hypothetical protein A7P95_01895 [Eikenella longinqua]|uniref:Uncharacterized protein n=1 Tax=Eikenella longinqua TaxID=1795827 RepID=A0A1A9S386_9NEIS|nr:hypothetical protein [Eikenella longinqua]OAM31263.1 hypothetical protein A7P95_01895 [Eikenella longinqua]